MLPKYDGTMELRHPPVLSRTRVDSTSAHRRRSYRTDAWRTGCWRQDGSADSNAGHAAARGPGSSRCKAAGSAYVGSNPTPSGDAALVGAVAVLRRCTGAGSWRRPSQSTALLTFAAHGESPRRVRRL
jgi:hypothetical protein